MRAVRHWTKWPREAVGHWQYSGSGWAGLGVMWQGDWTV